MMTKTKTKFIDNFVTKQNLTKTLVEKRVTRCEMEGGRHYYAFEACQNYILLTKSTVDLVN